MIPVRAYAGFSPAEPLRPWAFERRDPRPHDVVIDILYCGICHSDLHSVRDEWGGAVYPHVPGHEIVGTVRHVGSEVKRFKPGDRAGVGCYVDSCRQCGNCQAGDEQYCEDRTVYTYNDVERDGTTRTYGGYSTAIVTDEAFVFSIPDNLPLERVAPLLCAGITTYSPLRHWNVGKGHRLGVIGLGGLGHMAVKWGVALGAEVTVLSTSAKKEADAKRLGAHHFLNTGERGAFGRHENRFDFLLDAVSAPHNLNDYLSLLRRNGTLMLVGAPPDPLPIEPFSLITNRRRFAGSLIGGVRETQEMLAYCAQHQVLADVEVISAQDINTAYERMLQGDVRYRFVVDTRTL